MTPTELPAVSYTWLPRSLLFVDIIRPFGLSPTPTKLIVSGIQLLSVLDHNFTSFHRQSSTVMTTRSQPNDNQVGCQTCLAATHVD